MPIGTADATAIGTKYGTEGKVHNMAEQDIRKITVVCTGNICRSPMGDVMLNQAAKEAGLSVTINSCGLRDYHVGESADERAIAELKNQGFDGSQHVAAEFGPEHEDADVFLAMDRGHVDGLKELGVDADRIHLFRAFDADSFNPQDDPQGLRSENAPEVADPYYEDEAAFTEAATQIKAAVPGVLRELLSES